MQSDTISQDLNTRPLKRLRVDTGSADVSSTSQSPADYTVASSASSANEESTSYPRYEGESNLASRIGLLSFGQVRDAPKLRYTPPPSELHLHLVDDSVVPQTARPAKSTSTHGQAAPSNHESSGPTPPPIPPVNRGEVGTSRHDKQRKPPRPSIVPKREDSIVQAPRSPTSATASHPFHGSKNSIEGEDRFQKLLALMSEDINPTYSINVALDAMFNTKSLPRTRPQREEAVLSRLHRIYEDCTTRSIKDALSARKLWPISVVGEDWFTVAFEKVITQCPTTPLELLQVDEILEKLREPGAPRHALVDWVESVVSSIVHLKFTEIWNTVRVMKDRRRLNEAAFEAFHCQSQIAEWEAAGDLEDETRAWMKHLEKQVVARNQVRKLYNTFGATVILEANELRPVLLGEPFVRSGSFAILIKNIDLDFRSSIKKEDYLLLFQAKFWEDDLETEDLSADELYQEWITRSHNAASYLVTSIVKLVAGGPTAEWVAHFFKKNPPDGMIASRRDYDQTSSEDEDEDDGVDEAP